MKGKSLLFVLILSLAINASILGTMGYHYYRDASLAKDAPCPLSPAHQHLYQHLGLSTPQLAQMEPVAQKFHERLGQLETAMKGGNERLVELLGEREVDPGQVEGLRKEIAGIQDEIQREVIAHILETKRILDAKQKKQFFALMSKSMATGEIK
ncbi:MAG: periplasmic heavy metal sensor [Thermodesulfobacteriota bacterium]|jgi:Spy/CpxP family protein refolding chaperone